MVKQKRKPEKDGMSLEYSLSKTTKKIKRPIISIPLAKKRQGTLARDNEQKEEVFE